MIGREVPVAILESASACRRPSLRTADAAAQQRIAARAVGGGRGCTPSPSPGPGGLLPVAAARAPPADPCRSGQGAKTRSTIRGRSAAPARYHLEEAGEPMEAAQATHSSAMWVGTTIRARRSAAGRRCASCWPRCRDRNRPSGCGSTPACRSWDSAGASGCRGGSRQPVRGSARHRAGDQQPPGQCWPMPPTAGSSPSPDRPTTTCCACARRWRSRAKPRTRARR